MFGRRTFLLIALMLTILPLLSACDFPGGQSPTIRITQWQKTSTTVYWHSDYSNLTYDYLLSWDIGIKVYASGENVDAGQAKLMVSLYDSSGRYDVKSIDDLGPLTAGWENDYHLFFSITEEYEMNGYGEAILYLDGKQVDSVTMHW